MDARGQEPKRYDAKEHSIVRSEDSRSLSGYEHKVEDCCDTRASAIHVSRFRETENSVHGAGLESSGELVTTRVCLSCAPVKFLVDWGGCTTCGTTTVS